MPPESKHCHRALQVRTTVLGLDLLDVLALVVVCYPIGMFVGVLVGGAAAVLLGACIHLLKWGRLPDFTLDLLLYLFVVPENTPCVGHDAAALYPRVRRRRVAPRGSRPAPAPPVVERSRGKGGERCLVRP